MDKESLERYRGNKLMLQCIERQIRELDMDLAPRAVCITGMPGGGNRLPDAHMIDLIQRRAELLQKYMELKCDLLSDQMHAEQAVNRLQDPWRQVLAYRYMDGLSWRRIEELTHYSYSHLQRIHREALKRLDCK